MEDKLAVTYNHSSMRTEVEVIVLWMADLVINHSTCPWGKGS